MAVNVNNRHPCRYALFLGMPGCGKSTLVRNELKSFQAKRKGLVLIWDTNREHQAKYASTRLEWLALLQESCELRLTSKPVGYAPEVPTADEWQWFCRTVWVVLDGRNETLVIAEEMAAVSRGVGKEQDAAGRLINQGRKYGLIFWGTSQRPQEIAKTYYDNAAVLHVGQQRSKAMQRKMADELGASPDEVADLMPHEFLKSSPGQKVKKIRSNYR
jgi:hypothetical protein